MYEFLYKKTWAPSGLMAKLLLIMRLTTLLLITAILQVSASSLAQKITLSEKNTPLIKVFEKISNQTGYDFLVTKSMLKYAKPVNVTVKNEELKDVLKDIFEDQQLDYVIEERTVVISIKQQNILDKITSFFQQDTLVYKGRILDEKGEPLSGASVKVKGKGKATFTNNNGNFSIYAAPGAVLQISYIGYAMQEIKVSRADANQSMSFNLKMATQNLDEVGIVSTGYQNIPKERATGSFEVITNKQLNMVPGTNILKRLEGNTTDLDFNNMKYTTTSTNPNKKGILEGLTIRGINTLIGSSASGSRVLVVIDGVPLEDNGSKYTEDQISKINPNDVENITLLKDAVAASVYGSRAANGVIVITTKKAKLNQPLSVSVNAATTIQEKPDLFYYKRASTADFIDFQKQLYNLGQYDGYLNEPDETVLPLAVPLVAELMDMRKRGIITTDAELNAKLADLAKNDVRNDITKYILRNASLRSINASVSDGSDRLAYRFSAGYDKTLNNSVRSNNERITLSNFTTLRAAKNLNISLGLNYSKNNKNDLSINGYIAEAGNNFLMPYDRMADDQGNPLSVIRLNGSTGYRAGWVDTVGRGRLMDWHYYPLKELDNGYNRTRATDISLNLNADYKINDFLSATITYGYQNAATSNGNLDNVNSYYARDLNNRFNSGYFSFIVNGVTVNPFTPSISPVGGLYLATVDNLTAQNLRGQLNINKTWNGKHNLAGVIGGVVSKSQSLTRLDTYYGYSERFLTYANHINVKNVIGYGGQTGGELPYWGDAIVDNNINSTKTFANLSYTYNNRYTVSGSIAKDAYNLFGADRNKSFKPYWSTGFRWNISNESFYGLGFLPNLTLRTSFGYNGNLNYTNFPETFIINRPVNTETGLPTTNIQGNTNPLLRPEKTGQFAVGLDFGTKNNRLSGTLEYYDKRNKDLISSDFIDPTSGYTTTSYNVANMRGTGASVNLNSINIKSGDFTWGSNFYFSNNKVIVTKVYVDPATDALSSFSFQSRRQGYDVNSMFAFKWGGLDPATGAPRLMSGNTPVTDIFDLFLGTGSFDSLKYIGSATPKYFGSLRNSFSYKGLSISFNILYKLGYYFRRPYGTNALDYSSITSSASLPPIEYTRRWQKPGDEAFTNVPAFDYYADSFTWSAYRYADINVLKGDHIRLQEINLSYAFNKRIGFLKSATLQASVQNLGILWKANKEGIDPDVLDLPIPKIFSIGFSTNF